MVSPFRAGFSDPFEKWVIFFVKATAPCSMNVKLLAELELCSVTPNLVPRAFSSTIFKMAMSRWFGYPRGVPKTLVFWVSPSFGYPRTQIPNVLGIPTLARYSARTKTCIFFKWNCTKLSLISISLVLYSARTKTCIFFFHEIALNSALSYKY